MVQIITLEEEGLMLRRDVLKYIAAIAAMPGGALADDVQRGLQLGTEAPFDRGDIHLMAQELAMQPYSEGELIPAAWRDLNYDQYRALQFNVKNALWRGSETPVELDVFPPGLYFPRPVTIYAVDAAKQRRLLFDKAVFRVYEQFPENMPIDPSLGYSGLRLRSELKTEGKFEEFAVFQGASYFRAIGTGQNYGLSARGLALKTADPAGEEFPEFTTFWVERPTPGAGNVVVHALLDSPSCAGAYHFNIRHGSTLTMDVEAEIFARTDLAHVGIAPLTSMFLFDDMDRHRFDDFRRAVHDSDGLLMHNGSGEVIWRPLANPASLQISAFSDNNPRGFGLMQRSREYGDFKDLEAYYHNRPGLWVTPGEGWGRGHVALVEIPADLEIYDNIVAYWRSSKTIAAGASHKMTYRLDWGPSPASIAAPPLKILNTAAGARPEGGRVYVIDFEGDARVPEDLDQIEPIIRITAGEAGKGILQRNPETNGPRLAFTHYPGDATLAEFRVQLRHDGAPLSEVWLYRWTAE
ncbi:MAG: glucan biosynthesis protein [Paracoccaceae bacterium]|mgnify:CR=1 FL=1